MGIPQRWQQRAGTPVCLCCRYPIESEFCLDLHPFGIGGYACEGCTNKFTSYTQDLQEV